MPPSAACSEGNGANLDLKIPGAAWTVERLGRRSPSNVQKKTQSKAEQKPTSYILKTYYMVCVYGYENLGSDHSVFHGAMK